MTTLVFVHGTGVRQAAYRVTFERFVEKAAKIRPDSVVAGCYWGGPHGSRLNAGGASIPAGESYRGLETLLSGPTADADAEVALWGLLERDSLAELRLLSAAWASEEELAPHAEPTGQQLAARARRLLVSMPVMSQAASVGLDSVFPESVDAILGSQVTIGALRQERSLGGEVYALLARAFVADALRRADEELDGTFPLDGPHRADLIAAIVGELGGTDRGLGSALGRFGLSAALALGATRPVERRRSAITEASAPASGDVLMYLARGNAIRDFIAGTIHAADGPVVLIGHSLGGIACLDALASRALPKVELLVTVGSQAPFLYELNALPSLAFGHHLPTTVPRWVNIFDRRDLLAFTAASIFPGRARDCEVDCGAPFPRSHSAYFAHDRFYSVLNEILP